MKAPSDSSEMFLIKQQQQTAQMQFGLFTEVFFKVYKPLFFFNIEAIIVPLILTVAWTTAPILLSRQRADIVEPAA